MVITNYSKMTSLSLLKTKITDTSNNKKYMLRCASGVATLASFLCQRQYISKTAGDKLSLQMVLRVELI